MQRKKLALASLRWRAFQSHAGHPRQGYQWQGEPEGGPLAGSTLDPHLSLMPLDDRSADVQTQSQPDSGPALDLNAPGSMEALPDVFCSSAGSPGPSSRTQMPTCRSSLLHSNFDRAILR